MKNVKRLIALLMAATLIFSLSVSAFAEALITTKKTYQVVVKVLDLDGKEIETAKVGDKVYVASYFQKIADPSVSIDLIADASSTLYYNLDIPVNLLANKADFAGATDAEFNAVEGDALITDNVDVFTVYNVIDVTGGITIDPQVPIDKHEITVGAVGTYDISFFNVGCQSGTVPAKQIQKVGTTLTVEEGKKDPAITKAEAVNKSGVTTLDGTVRYDNAYEIKVTLTAAAGSAVGVEFVPAFMSESIDDIWQFAAETTVYSAALGAGDTEFRAALIGIPVDVKDAKFDMLARPFVKNSEGKKTYGDTVTQEIEYTIPEA